MPASTADALSVTQLLRRMKNLLEIQIGSVWVEGEVSNMRKQASGHWYFSLKDEGAQIACAMFGARRREGADVLADGAKVRIFAETSVYEARGQLQVIVQKAELAGAGDLQARFDALKRKLAAEGLFDSDRKRNLPPFPRTIGLVTSPTGAALQDMLNVLTRRAPWVRAVLCPVRVQGKGAEIEIARAIRRMGQPDKHGDPHCEVIIVGRGGGSLEDLWNFNEEVVARAIAESPIPIISAVGHEIDFTIADFAADVRAPTPSAAAELVVPDRAELLARVEHSGRRMSRCMSQRIDQARRSLDSHRRGALRRDGERLLREPVQRLDNARMRLTAATMRRLDEAGAQLREFAATHRGLHPSAIVTRRMENLSGMRRRLDAATSNRFLEKQSAVQRLRATLRALGPESAFQRGFSITLGPDGRAVKSVAELASGDTLRTRFADGETRSKVL